MRGHLAIKNIGLFSGQFIGRDDSCSGDVVHYNSPAFNYEILTDPMYQNKIVITECDIFESRQPHPEEIQSFLPHLKALILAGRTAKNALSDENGLAGYIKDNNIRCFIPDRRELLSDLIKIKIPSAGAIDRSKESALERLSANTKLNYDDLKSVSSPHEYIWDLSTREYPPESKTAVVWDLGSNYNLLRSLRTLGYKVRVAAYNVEPEEIIALNPDTIVITGGPASIRNLGRVTPTIERLIGIKPILAIGYGAVLVGAAMGMQIDETEYHHFGNTILIENLQTGKSEVSCQAHNYSLNAGSVESSGAGISSINVIDESVEGFYHDEYEICASFCLPSPEDIPSYFREFMAFKNHESIDI